eukprot:m.344381 g.344381  ORF g.344381 m.344381 type:complete len:896 (-) comp24323_c0_seq1:58-2745(-)
MFMMILLLFISCTTSVAVTVPGTLPSMNIVPRSDWLSVKLMGAKGDGKTDDTAAIQKALNLMSGCQGIPSLLNVTAYFPPGSYIISQTLQLCGQAQPGFNLIGHGASTQLLWSGALNGTMMHDNGTTYGSVKGIVFDGQGKAGIGLEHNSHSHYGTMMYHNNLAFQNLLFAGMITDVGGGTVMATAEVYVRNCIFSTVRYGLYLHDYNDYDYAVDGCLFQDTQIAIYSPHGNFDVRDTRFERSNISDIYFGAIASGVHRVVSVNSTMFAIGGGWCAASSPMIIEDVRVYGLKGSAYGGWWDRFAPLPAIGLAFRGPLTLVDSSFTNTPDPELPTPPLVASWTPLFSYNVSGHDDVYGWQPYNETYFWGRTIILANNNYTGPHTAVFPQDNVITNDMPSTTTVTPIDQNTNFLLPWWPTSPKIFDVKKDFKANGTGHNDTDAILACVAAAATAGDGATCYFPPGQYVTYATIPLQGGNFSVEGAGFKTMLTKMAANTTMFPDEKNASMFEMSNTNAGQVEIKQFQLIGKEPGSPLIYMGPPKTPSLKRFLLLEYILGRESPMSVPCPDTEKKNIRGCGAWGKRCSDPSGCVDTPQDRSLRTAVVFEELGEGDTIIADIVEVGMYFKDCAAATYLMNMGSGYRVIEAPKATAMKKELTKCEISPSSELCNTLQSLVLSQSAGFIGELMHFDSGNAFDLTVRDGQNYASGYFYTESTERVVHLGPGSGLGEGGMVTMVGTKGSTFGDEDLIVVDSWTGNFSYLKSLVQIQGKSTTNPPMSLNLNAQTAPTSNILLSGLAFGEDPPGLSINGGQLHTLGNTLSYGDIPPTTSTAWCLKSGHYYNRSTIPYTQSQTCTIPDSSSKDKTDTTRMQVFRAALDHLRQLGRYDLVLNYGFKQW